MVEIEIKTLEHLVLILFKNVCEIMELGNFPNLHHKLYVRINVKELKVSISNFM